ncbi:NAD(P)-dependent alcohol dehydrogenase [Bacillus suaedae]|uniref:NAD(P)-dependent alcohol dehydrogenase n=1 Tax=Halalkalibacter suaedae TaxID=2822140 RepID=A0A940WW95_9BACI|nr:NAD(P)-dependent alcohol dehydrogenase [Bacillus suaedae]MBP3951652.1 NAD(P)-dependent alcohol dehydrogenase [Bacillus suaedae]
MKAIICREYGSADVLQLQEVEKPVPKENEILVRVHSTAVNSADWRLRKAEPAAVRLFFGLTKPRKGILGGVFSGAVEAVGKGVTRFKVDDLLYGSTGMRLGAYAEYICLSEKGAIVTKPKNMSFEEAVSIPFGGLTALHFLKKARVEKRQSIFIYGASGAVGTMAVQLAKYFEAEVTGVCSTANLDLVTSLGADYVIDYTQEDVASSGRSYDIIFDTVGKMSFSASKKLVKKEGIIILGSSNVSKEIQGVWTSISSSRKVISGVASEKADDLIFLKELIEQGYIKPVIDKNYKLEEIPNAHRYVEQGHKKGNVVITII